jgi:hypothetical protein
MDDFKIYGWDYLTDIEVKRMLAEHFTEADKITLEKIRNHSYHNACDVCERLGNRLKK